MTAGVFLLVAAVGPPRLRPKRSWPHAGATIRFICCTGGFSIIFAFQTARCALIAALPYLHHLRTQPSALQNEDLSNLPKSMKRKIATRPIMKLATAGGLRRTRPSKTLVLRTLSELDTGFSNSFCNLGSPGNNYVQTLHGLNGWHLEWRVTNPLNINRYRHYRASRKLGSNRARLLRKSDKFVSRGLERDLLSLEEVERCFLAFWSLAGRPAEFEWRRLKI